MTNDTVHSYTYDAEGNILQVDAGNTAVYVYDALNRRVHVQTASATNEFAYDYAGRRVSTWLSPNNSGSEGRIYWDGLQIAFRSTDGTTYFDHQDILGTERMRTNYAGSVGSTYLSLPWGDGYTATVNASGADQDNLHFAGLEHDAESDTEHAQFRNYASAQGRWLAPDPYMGSYDLTNPQSMNRYAYVLNNPTSFIDPLGLDQAPDCDADDTVCVNGGNDGGGGAVADLLAPQRPQVRVSLAVLRIQQATTVSPVVFTPSELVTMAGSVAF
jgi:RHS repeat-associated protein